MLRKPANLSADFDFDQLGTPILSTALAPVTIRNILSERLEGPDWRQHKEVFRRCGLTQLGNYQVSSRYPPHNDSLTALRTTSVCSWISGQRVVGNTRMAIRL